MPNADDITPCSRRLTCDDAVADEQGNKITSDGATLLARGLMKNKGIITINLLRQQKHFGESCLEVWLEMFEEHNYTLQNIKVFYAAVFATTQSKTHQLAEPSGKCTVKRAPG